MIVGVSLPRLLLSNLLLNSMTSAFSRKVSRVSFSFSIFVRPCPSLLGLNSYLARPLLCPLLNSNKNPDLVPQC